MRSFSIAVALVSLSACHLYFPGDDDGDDGCNFGGGGEQPPGAQAADGLRNPDTGQCEYFGNPWGCDDPCEPCPGSEADQAGVPQPSWGYCESYCTGLDEATCLEADGCRGIYEYGFDGNEYFSQCWQTDFAGPIQGGGCDGLDAYTCSMHDDCAAVHNSLCPALQADEPVCGPADFILCRDENPITCFTEVLCDSLPPECPDPGTVPAISNGCFTGQCVTVDQCETPPACEDIAVESTCIGMADCEPLYKGVDCVCDAMGNCDCADWLFEGCETTPTPDPMP